jgi:hypothetical protein
MVGTCILSTLTESVDGDSVATTSPLKNQEWNGFLRMLGAAIVNGFRDRCRRYDEELRRLDAARATGNRMLSKLGKGSKTSFDLGHFFLVKESLAFTYVQMQIPSEALLQYEELRAFLPETSGDDESVVESEAEKISRQKKAVKVQSKDFDDVATELAVAGDSLAFRKRLRRSLIWGSLSKPCCSTCTLAKPSSFCRWGIQLKSSAARTLSSKLCIK